MASKYYYLNRPPGSGCQPDGFTNHESWLPKQCPSEFPRGAFGWVEYPEPLPLEAIWKYDLFPQDTLQRTIYLAWQDSNQDPVAARLFLKEFWDLDRATLDSFVAGEHFTAIDVRACKDAGYTWQEAEALLGQPVAE